MTSKQATVLGHPIGGPITLPVNMSKENRLATVDYMPNVIKDGSYPLRSVHLILDCFNDKLVITFH